MNRVILMGRLVANPEFSMTQTGIPMCRFRIAVDRPTSKNSQNGQEQADFFRVTCWRQTAEFVNRYFVKGKPILLEGKVQNNNYTDQNGVQHYSDEIIADNISFVLSDPTRTAGGSYNNGYGGNGGYNNSYNNNNYGGYQGQNNQYNNGGYNNNPSYGGNHYQNNNYGNQPSYPQDAAYQNAPAPSPSAPAQNPAPAPAPEPPKDVQLGNSGLKDFEELISDGDVPF